MLDTQELYKIFGQRLEDALKSKENFKGRNQIKFIEIEGWTLRLPLQGTGFLCRVVDIWKRGMPWMLILLPRSSDNWNRLWLRVIRLKFELDGNRRGHRQQHLRDCRGHQELYIASNVNKILNRWRRRWRGLSRISMEMKGTTSLCYSRHCVIMI